MRENKLAVSECAAIDKYLYSVVKLIDASLQLNIGGKETEISECRIDKNIVFYFDNGLLGLNGYVGRAANTGKITFMVLDHARINWAIHEGFTREEAFSKVGCFLKLKDINDFINFISGIDEYKADWNYIKAE